MGRCDGANLPHPNYYYYTGVIRCFEFSDGGVTDSDRAFSSPSGPPWGVGGYNTLYYKTNTPLLHAQDLTRPRPQGPGEFGIKESALVSYWCCLGISENALLLYWSSHVQNNVDFHLGRVIKNV